MKKTLKMMMPAAALVATMTVAPDAGRAEESHLYSAQTCTGYSAADRAAAIIYNVAGIRNQGSSASLVQLSCPMNLISNDPSFQPPIDYKWIWAMVQDKSTATGFNCQPAIKDATGAYWYGPTMTTSNPLTSGGVDEPLLWLNPFNGGNPFPNMVIMSHMRCYLPGNNSDLLSINSTLE